MRKPQTRRHEGTANAFDISAQPKANSGLNFYIPPTLESDFENWLMTGLDAVNHTFEIIRDWYAAQHVDYEPEFIRATYVPIDWKSKIGNSDSNSNFKTKRGLDIKKGDIVVCETGEIYMINWKVQQYPNNQSTQAIDCNAYLEFVRHIAEQVDNRGYLIEPAHDEVIAPKIPGVYADYSGRPDYAANQSTPGLIADGQITVQLQYNRVTEMIRLHDEFEQMNYRYRVVHISGREIDIDRQYGILNQMARRVAGEDADEWTV